MKTFYINMLIITALFSLVSCNQNIKKQELPIQKTKQEVNSTIKESEKKENKFLGAGYERKENGIYYFDKKLVKADRETFVLLNNPIWSEYAVDKDSVFGFGNYLKEANKDSFEVLSFRYAKDENNVYCFGEELLGSESNSFINTSEMDTYAKDNNHVYFNCNIINEADPESFEVIRGGEGIAKDKDAVYCGYEKINRIDVNTYNVFVIKTSKGEMLSEYSKDENNVYYSCNKIIEGADPQSFEIINPFFAKDKNHIYKYSKIVDGIDPNDYTIEELGEKIKEL